MDDFQLAYAHYCLLFPDLESLGDDAADWRTEYDRVVACGLAATLITSNSQAGDVTAASKNFDQRTLLTALHLRRAKIDETYTAASELPPAALQPIHGYIVRLGP